MSMIAKCLKSPMSRMSPVIKLYQEGKMIKYRVLSYLNFTTYFNYVALDYLSVLHKKKDIFDAIFSEQNLCYLLGSVLSYLSIYILPCYVDVYSWGKDINFLLTFHNAPANYYVSHQFYITKPDEYEVNKQF